jgi:transcriptional regulator with XRE-family HTH domain
MVWTLPSACGKWKDPILSPYSSFEAHAKGGWVGRITDDRQDGLGRLNRRRVAKYVATEPWALSGVGGLRRRAVFGRFAGATARSRPEVETGVRDGEPEAAERPSLGRWLYLLRVRRGLSQEQVAHAAGIAVATYGRIERCLGPCVSVNPRLATMARILAALHAEPSELHALFSRVALFPLDRTDDTEDGDPRGAPRVDPPVTRRG